MGKISKKQTRVYLIAIAVIVIAFLLLGGGHWMNERSSHMNHWNWTQIIISITIGFVIGLFAAKRKWL